MENENGDWDIVPSLISDPRRNGFTLLFEYRNNIECGGNIRPNYPSWELKKGNRQKYTYFYSISPT